MNSGPVALPRTRARDMPPVTVATSRETFCQGVSATTSTAAASGIFLGAGGGGAGRGAVGTMEPLCVTMEPRTTSSLRSMPKCFSCGDMERRSLVMLLE